MDTAFTVMVNEQGLARDSTLVFAKGVVDVDLALYVEGHHPGQSALGGPRVVILFLAIRGRNEVRSWAGAMTQSSLHPLSEYRVQRNRVAEVEDDYGTNPTHEPTENRSCKRSYGGQHV